MPKARPVEVDPGEFAMRIENPYSARHRVVPGLDCSGDVGRTHPEFKDECDINLIMRKYTKSGVLPGSVAGAAYGDFSFSGDFLEAQNIILRAKEQFSGLSAELRSRFRNDPALFLDFVHDTRNLDEARKLGLLKDEVVPPAVPAAPVVPK
ncbi:MAG: internal scaffolding protein [Microvirus sp.]|nr:MAG: internal scaffolding protein [Microvirus sp.]